MASLLDSRHTYLKQTLGSFSYVCSHFGGFRRIFLQPAAVRMIFSPAYNLTSADRTANL